jgi:hypothetical protein
MRDYRRGSKLVTGFIDLLQLVSTINSNAIAIYHNLQFIMASTCYFRSTVSSPVLWYRLPTVDVPLPLGSRTVPLPHNYYFLKKTHCTMNLSAIFKKAVFTNGTPVQ